MIREKVTSAWSGLVMLVVLIALFGLFVAGLINSISGGAVPLILTFIVLMASTIICVNGFFIVNPNEAQVLTLFGNYMGSVKVSGFWWVNPFAARRRLSLRVRNFESAKLKVNDHDGNPIEIAAVVVWRVVETAEAAFEVDDYSNFLHVQTEAAVRNLASSHAYDSHVEGRMSLRANTVEIAADLKREIQARLERAGLEVIEARISHLAYAPEIASAMLQRQQASAIVAARSKIVEGAVGMVEMALEELARKQVVVLDDERKAAMVSNLLVVLCSDRHTQPVVNTGTLYN